MPKPTSKAELVKASQQHFAQLNEMIDTLSEKERLAEFPPGTMNRNIRDVLAHLHHWHLMLMEWYETGMQGEKPDMPAKGFSWKETPLLNKKIWNDYQDVPLKKVRHMLNQSFSDVHSIIKKHSNDELFEKKRYHWTGSTSLGAYLISNTSSHYDWAFRLIKRVRK